MAEAMGEGGGGLVTGVLVHDPSVVDVLLGELVAVEQDVVVAVAGRAKEDALLGSEGDHVTQLLVLRVQIGCLQRSGKRKV